MDREQARALVEADLCALRADALCRELAAVMADYRLAGPPDPRIAVLLLEFAWILAELRRHEIALQSTWEVQ